MGSNTMRTEELLAQMFLANFWGMLHLVPNWHKKVGKRDLADFWEGDSGRTYGRTWQERSRGLLGNAAPCSKLAQKSRQKRPRGLLGNAAPCSKLAQICRQKRPRRLLGNAAPCSKLAQKSRQESLRFECLERLSLRKKTSTK